MKIIRADFFPEALFKRHSRLDIMDGYKDSQMLFADFLCGSRLTVMCTLIDFPRLNSYLPRTRLARIVSNG